MLTPIRRRTDSFPRRGDHDRVIDDFGTSPKDKGTEIVRSKDTPLVAIMSQSVPLPRRVIDCLQIANPICLLFDQSRRCSGMISRKIDLDIDVTNY